MKLLVGGNSIYGNNCAGNVGGKDVQVLVRGSLCLLPIVNVSMFNS